MAAKMAFMSDLQTDSRKRCHSMELQRGFRRPMFKSSRDRPAMKPPRDPVLSVVAGCLQPVSVEGPLQRVGALARSYPRHASDDHPYLAEIRGAPALGLSPPRRLKQEPCAPLGLIDPDFQQACGGNILVLVAKVMHLAQVATDCLLSSRNSASIYIVVTKSESVST